ncbi:MAG: bifunctional UDP-N-acetylmuramoyl-tripeptide:D-alanyl-D-alanine ligase/alanine racemase [Chitinophagaceae bacterium]|nr:bifunctional UDP-N-acetylmuramoyl-tripeptide:D-alanyl-D-alanine ligase/alanine racemase [Chitinophagaceae bacterium]
MFNISTIAYCLNATWLQKGSDDVIEHLLIDSRKLLFPESSLFFAISTLQRNAHDFLDELYNKGVRNFVVDNEYSLKPTINNANVLQVSNVIDALQLLTAYHRKQFTYPVIGITGSNGKTIVKEWLYQLLHNKYNIVRSPKSYNSQIGVPLSVWQMHPNNTLGIFEAGISMPHEMDKLQKIIQPTIGIFTSIGEAHSEGFDDTAHKVEEKAKLFEGCKEIIYCKDNAAIALAIESKCNTCHLFSWSKKDGATLSITAIQIQHYNTVIKAIYQNRKVSISVPFTNDAAIENAITCWCVLLHFGVDDETISAQMLQLRSVEMRLELKQGVNNCSVINDSYSADINSLTIALDFLQQQQQHDKRTVILSDILQSGKKNVDLYTEVASILIQKNINRFIGIGTEITKQQAVFSSIPQVHFYTSTNDFKQHFPSLHFNSETILLKGARVFEFEQISHLLEQKVHQTILEINLNAISHNLKIYKQQLAEGVKLMAMVKAFSYGSGGFEIANLLQFHKVDYLAVAYADEGVELRKAGITLPIMVMNAEDATFDVLVQYNLEPELYSFEIFNGFDNYLLQSGISNYPVHIKIDTGMKRLGFELDEITTLCNKLKETTSFKIQSVFSHLAASDNAEHDAFTQEQATTIKEGCQLLQEAIDYPFIKHIANTSAIHRHKNLQFDMVRLGIGLYGVDAHTTVQQQLKNVTTLKTTISQIKKIKKGQSVGYSRKGLTNEDATIATVRIGYADGYPRVLSNGKGKMLVNGKLAPVIGNVCMDMTMLDITNIPAKEGDDVIVFGEALPVNNLAHWADTIAYEILTGISQRVKRVYFEE